jgi:hypothetical protein
MGSRDTGEVLAELAAKLRPHKQVVRSHRTAVTPVRSGSRFENTTKHLVFYTDATVSVTYANCRRCRRE